MKRFSKEESFKINDFKDFEGNIVKTASIYFKADRWWHKRPIWRFCRFETDRQTILELELEHKVYKKNVKIQKIIKICFAVGIILLYFYHKTR